MTIEELENKIMELFTAPGDMVEVVKSIISKSLKRDDALNYVEFKHEASCYLYFNLVNHPGFKKGAYFAIHMQSIEKYKNFKEKGAEFDIFLTPRNHCGWLYQNELDIIFIQK